MAYLGPIGVSRSLLRSSKTDRTWSSPTIRAFFLRSVAAAYNLVGQRSKVSGVVRENNVVAARTVRAYNQTTGELLGSTVSSAYDGTYQIPLGYSGEVFVVAFDDTGAPVLSADIVSSVTAV